MIVRAGGLDQGNIILNLVDAERRGQIANMLFLAGSAINSVKNAAGRPDPQARNRGHAPGIGSAPLGRIGRHVDGRAPAALVAVARAKELTALLEALRNDTRRSSP